MEMVAEIMKTKLLTEDSYKGVRISEKAKSFLR
jgi:hypothetical protein